MGFLSWLRALRLRSLREQLAVVEALIAMEERSMRITKTAYPMVLERNARDLARIKFRIGELTAPK